MPLNWIASWFISSLSVAQLILSKLYRNLGSEYQAWTEPKLNLNQSGCSWKSAQCPDTISSVKWNYWSDSERISLSLFTGWGNISPQSDGFMSEWIQVGNDIDFAQSFGWRISNSWFINEVLIHRSLQTVTASVYIFPYKHVDGYHSWTNGSIFHPLHSV